MGKFEGKGIGGIEASQSHGWQQLSFINKTTVLKHTSNPILFLAGG